MFLHGCRPNRILWLVEIHVGKLLSNWDGPFSIWPGLDAIISRNCCSVEILDNREIHGIVWDSWEINCKTFSSLVSHFIADSHNWLVLRTTVLGNLLWICGTSGEAAAISSHFSSFMRWPPLTKYSQNCFCVGDMRYLGFSSILASVVLVLANLLWLLAESSSHVNLTRTPSSHGVHMRFMCAHFYFTFVKYRSSDLVFRTKSQLLVSGS